MGSICSVPAKPLPMQILALANNAGKANQVSMCKVALADVPMAPRLPTCDVAPLRVLTCLHNAGMQMQYAQMTYAALAYHRQPHLDCLAYLSQLTLYQNNVSKLPLLALIYQNNISWRSCRMFLRDPSIAMNKQRYYDMSTVLLKVATTMPDALVKTKVQHPHKLYFPVDRHLVSHKFPHYCC